MGYGSYWLHLFIFRGCSTLKCTLTAVFTRISFSFPYTREGKELRKKLLSSLAQTSGCGAAPSGLLSETAGSAALLHLPALWHISAHICCKRAVCLLSRAWENQQGQQGGRTTFADGVTTSPSLLEADAGLGLFRMFSAMLFIHLHLRMSTHNY